MTPTRLLAAPLTVLLLLVGACASSPTSPIASLTGEWQGTIESGGDGPGSVTFDFDQEGLDVTGTAQLSQNGISGVVGTLTGSLIAPGTLQYVVTYEYGPFHCQGTFSGTATITGRKLEGPFTGENCVGPFSGTVHAARGQSEVAKPR